MARKLSVDEPQSGDFINHIYSVAIDPARFVDLVERWDRRLAQAESAEHAVAGASGIAKQSGSEPIVEVLDRVISAHASRIAELLAGFSTAAVIFNARGLMVAVNEAATAVFGLMPGHRLSDLGIDDSDLQPLADEIASLASASKCGNAIVRFRMMDASYKILAHLRAVDAGASGRHVIMVTSEHSWPEELTGLLTRTYGITRQEGIVLQCITRGETVHDIAIASGRSIATIRSQVQSLLQKTQLGSQTELVRLASTLLHAMGGPAIKDNVPGAPKQLPPYVLEPLQLPDGRKIHYRLAGARHGRPFLLLPSGQGFIRWTDAAEAEMARRGLTMIAPARAGYGPSSPIPAGCNVYDLAADDHASLLSQLGIEACPVVAICDDIKIALHMEQRHRGIFTAVIGAAATMPLASPEHFARLTKFVRFVQMNATHAPRTLPYVTLLFFHMARRLGTRRFLETMMASCPADVVALQSDAIADPLVASTQIVMTEHFMAHYAWSQEIIQFARPWPRLLLDSSVPVTLLAGTHDPFSPIETVRDYCREKPSIELIEIADAGQTLVYTHHALVLDAVERALARPG